MSKDAKASTDINDKDDDPYPQDNGDNRHGTRCAGEVASMAGNEYCGVGVAYNAGIGGIKIHTNTCRHTHQYSCYLFVHLYHLFQLYHANG